MFCQYCGSQISENLEFCPNCGSKLKQAEAVQPVVEQQPVQPEQTIEPQQTAQPVIEPQVEQVYSQPTNNNYNQSKKSDNKKFIVIIIIILVLALVALLFASKLLNKKSKGNDIPTETGPETVRPIETTPETTVPAEDLVYDKNGAFLMTIEDVFTISGKGTVVTGRVERGTVKLNDEIQIIGMDHKVITTTVQGLEFDRKTLESAEMGDSVGIYIGNISREDVERGQVVAKPNSIQSRNKFEVEFDLFGETNTTISDNEEFKIYIRTNTIDGVIKLPDGQKSVKTGTKNVKMIVELETNMAVDVGTKLEIRRANFRTVGKGVVTKVY